MIGESPDAATKRYQAVADRRKKDREHGRRVNGLLTLAAAITNPDKRISGKLLKRPRGTGSRKSRAAYRKSVYGLTPEAHAAMIEEQGGRCAICGVQPECPDAGLFVDHCHATGAVRGLLCPLCNSGLGSFADDTTRLAEAIEYLKRHAEKESAA
jgi:hypothetical protein